MEEKIVQEVVRKRVQENQKLFTKEELEFIKDNSILIQKIYLLGNMDCYTIYGKNLQK